MISEYVMFGRMPQKAEEPEATDLLAACETLLERFVELGHSGDCGFWNPDECDVVITARAAIARARGEE